MAVQATVERIKRKISQLSIGTYDESADEKIPGGVLAHSTITKMLSLTNRETTFSKTDLKFTDQMERRELRVLGALATVLGRPGEVVAVAKSDDGFGGVEVVVATHLVRNEERRPTKKLGSFGEHFWKIFANEPPRRDGQRDSISSSPTIVNPSLPQLEFENIDWLKQSINMGCREDPLKPFDTHVWIVSKLLNKIKSGGGAKAYLLQQYIITTTFPRMLRRLTHPTLAKPFRDSLKNLSISRIPELLATAPQHGESEADKVFLKTTVDLNRFVRTELPNLLQQANAAAANDPYNTYTEDTSIEFHKLLCELLERFEEQLNSLESYLAGTAVKRQQSYEDILLHAIFYGDALHRLARSDAIASHLKAISPSLADPRRDKTGDVTIGEITAQEEGDDNELDSVQPTAIHEGGALQPLWKSYLDWLRLVVDHFDAVLILGGYVGGKNFPYSSLSLKILTTPPVSSDVMLPWKDLLRSEHFPDIAAQNRPNSTPLPRTTVTDLIDKLEDWSRSDKHPQEHATDVHDILQNVGDGSLLFSNLRQEPLLLGIGFDGSRHCEMSLATLIYLSRTLTSGPIYNKYRHVLDQLRNAGTVIGTSNRCCPFCRCLLHALSMDGEVPFLMRGSHSAFTACALPVWLPDNFVKHMNTVFGSQLRRNLIEILSCLEVGRNRTQSTGSDRLSLDSLASEWGSSVQVLEDRGATMEHLISLK